MRRLFAVLPLAVLLAACGDQPTAPDTSVPGQLGSVGWSQSALPVRIISFGDSHSDLGNLHAATGGFVAAPPYFLGRWTNGPSWIDELATQLGVPAVSASLLGGTGFAWGGAETGAGWLIDDFIPNVGGQIEDFLSDDAPDGDDLLVIWAGTNDGINGKAPAEAAENISKHISDLADAGGRLFLVPDLHSLSLAPMFAGAPGAPGAKAWTREFNLVLREELKALKKSRHEITILRFEESEIIAMMMDHPRKYGLRDVTNQACDGCFENGTGVPVQNPDHYLWWDAVHFTRVVHRILGAEAAKLVLRDER